jgi:hypothetical protein
MRGADVRDSYRHDPNEDPSYFVRLQTLDGPREVRGKDIERAVAKSLTQPQRGDEVGLQRTGRDTVTVQRQEKDARGALQPQAMEVYRNRWVIKKREFFEQVPPPPRSSATRRSNRGRQYASIRSSREPISISVPPSSPREPYAIRRISGVSWLRCAMLLRTTSSAASRCSCANAPWKRRTARH